MVRARRPAQGISEVMLDCIVLINLVLETGENSIVIQFDIETLFHLASALLKGRHVGN